VTLRDEAKKMIYVVDDDESVRRALKMLFLSADMDVATYAAAEDLLKVKLLEKNACLISDIKMPGLSGFELQQRLTERGVNIPVIFLTAFDSDANRQCAKQAGALGYLRKPVDDQALIDTIKWALNGPVSK
jgi:FixJ family two-component response regulator